MARPKYCNPVCMFVFRLIYSGVGILVGISVAAAFTVVFNNKHAAFWGLSSAFLAALSMGQFIYLYIIKERKRQAPSPILLTVFGLIGALGIGVGIAGFVTYLGLGIIQSLNHQVSSLVESNYIVCVWSFAVFKWAVTTYVYSMISFKYIKKVPRGFQKFVDDEILAEENEGGDIDSPEVAVNDSVDPEKKLPVNNALEV